MSLRPGGEPPSFAATANYPAGTDPWSGQPSKVDPGAGIKAQGFVPGQGLPAQFVNWLLNAQGGWLNYQDTLEARTYSQPSIPQAGSHDLANMLQDNCALFNAENSKYFLGGQDQTDSNIPLVLRSSNGETWVSDGAPVITPDATPQTYQIVDSPADGVFAWIAHGSGQQYCRRGSDGVWAGPFTLANGQKTFVARWFVDRWVGAGEVSGAHVGVFTFKPTTNTGSSGTLATPSLPGASGVTLSAEFAPLMAKSDTLPLLIVGAPSGAADLWTTPDGVTFTHVPNPFAGGASLLFLTWNAGDALFYAGTIEAGVSKAYTSPDGATWTLAYTWSGWGWSRSRAQAAIDASYAVGIVAAQGGLVVAQVQRSTLDGAIQTGLAVGRNAGSDWDVIANPNQVATRMGVGSSLSSIALVGDRIATIREDDPTNNRGGAVSYSLRIV